MRLILAKNKIFALKHLIIAERWDGEPTEPNWGPGCVRVVLRPGYKVEFSGDVAEDLWRQLEEYVRTESASPSPSGPTVKPTSSTELKPPGPSAEPARRRQRRPKPG